MALARVVSFNGVDSQRMSQLKTEIEGGGPDLTSRNSLLTPGHAHELEGKLIFSSDYRDWNISENFIFTKSFSESEGVEFGYAFGAYRPLATLASAADCRWCRENFVAGIEMYGGMGSTLDFDVRGSALRVVVKGRDIYDEAPPMTPYALHQDLRNRGRHTIHTGGRFDSHLLVPVVPRAGA